MQKLQYFYIGCNESIINRVKFRENLRKIAPFWRDFYDFEPAFGAIQARS